MRRSGIYKRPVVLGLSLAFFGLVALRCGHDSAIKITKIDTVTVYVKLASPENGGGKILSQPEGIAINGNGDSELVVPVGQDVELNLKLDKGWEIEDQSVMPSAPKTPGFTKQIRFSAIKADQHISYRLKRIDKVNFVIKVTGNRASTPGSGMVSWVMYPPGADPESGFWDDSHFCGTGDGLKPGEFFTCSNSNSNHKDKYAAGYPNGSIVVITIEGHKKRNFSYYKYKRPPMVLTDHYEESFSFFPDAEKED